MTTARIVALLSVVAVVTAQYPAPTAYGGGGGYSAYGAAPTMSYGAGASSYGAAMENLVVTARWRYAETVV
eukprot:1172399-Prorocentrum_minimum.AAC.2